MISINSVAKNFLKVAVATDFFIGIIGSFEVIKTFAAHQYLATIYHKSLCPSHTRHTTVLCIITWSFTKFYYKFHSPKVKQNLISSIKNHICELPNELPNDTEGYTGDPFLVK